MSPDEENEIRKALASEEFAKAQRLWGDYMERLRQAILRGEATAGDMAQAAGLLESARLSVFNFRAQASARIAESRAASAYSQGASCSTRHTRAIL